jgi:hypothetical protein
MVSEDKQAINGNDKAEYMEIMFHSIFLVKENKIRSCHALL